MLCAFSAIIIFGTLSIRVPDKPIFLMIIQGKFSLYLIETICCDPSSEPFRRDVQMRGYNICLCAEMTKIIPNYHQCFLISRFLSIKGRVLKGRWSFFVKIGTLCGLKLQNCIAVSLHCRNRQEILDFSPHVFRLHTCSFFSVIFSSKFSVS